jgi:hypothetical protein
MAQRRDGVRWGRVLLVVVALLVINTPYVLHEWSLNRARTHGTPVSATVVEVSQDGSDLDVSFKLPTSVDSAQKRRTVTVHRDVGVAASHTGRLEVKVLDGNPSEFYVDGQVRRLSPLYLTLVADALIALMLLLSWRLGGRIRRPTLVGVAIEDVGAGDDGSLLDKQDDGTYIVNGEVVSADDTSLLLTLRDRDIRIHLRDHESAVAVGDQARVRAHLVG